MPVAPAFPQQAAAALEDRRAEIERQRDAQAQYFKVSGLIEVSGQGDAQISVAFPVRFIDKPVVHFGGEILPGAAAAAYGFFPSWSAMVQSWDFRFRPDGSFLYVGALMGVTLFGPVDIVANIHWSVEGTGLRNPSTEFDDDTTT